MMRDTQTASLSRLGFWLLIALLALFAASKVVVYDSLDPDCFWHLRVAGQLLRGGIRPIVDDLSFASNRQPWTPYSWLAELGMKLLWDCGGLPAVVGATALVEAGIVVLLAKCCLELQDAPRYLATVLATSVGAFLILPYLSFRPVTFAFGILFLIAWLLLRDRRLSTRRSGACLCLAVPLTAILTNIHLFSFFVPAMLLAMAMGEMIETDAQPHRHAARRYCILATLTAMACLATPMLPGLLHTIFFYSSNDKMVTGRVIVEMQSIFRGTMGLATAVGAIAMLLCIARQWRIVPVGLLIAIVASTLLMLKLGRFAPIFALAVCPALAATLPAIKDRLLGKPAMIALFAVVVLAGSCRLIIAFPRPSTTVSAWVNRNGKDAPGYPCEAADFVARAVVPTRPVGRLINEFSWGGYLAWRLEGKYQVLLDGRTQVYPQALWQATYLGSETQRRAFLANLPADAALVPANKSLFRQSLVQLGWTSVYKDDRAEVLLPPRGLTQCE